MKLNEQQMQVVNSNSDKIVCIASAGSGKTATMLCRIDRLVSEGVAADSILVLTFTNAAAQELTDRYMRNHPSETVIPVFKTFHAFCYSLIAKDVDVRSCLGYGSIPSIATDEDIRRIRMLIIASCKIKLSEKKLSMDRKLLLPKEQFEYDVYWKAYKKQMCIENKITFDMMCNDVSKLFVDNSSVVKIYKDKYRYIMCDEHQDTDTTQFAFVDSFTSAKLFVCGDPQQMLYRFRGCTNDIIKRLAESPEWELIKLPHNYRSTKEIVDFSNQIFAKKWKDSPYYIAGETDKVGEPIIKKGAFPCKSKDLIDIAVQMQQDINNKKTVAILCRTNALVAEIQSMFKELNIPVRGKADNSDIIGLLKSILDSNFCVQWIAGKLPNEDYLQYLRLSTLDPSYNEEQKFLQTFGGKYVRLLDKLFECRNIMSQNKLIPEMIADLAKFLHIEGKVDITKVFDKSMQESIDYLIDIINTSVNQGIYIGTIHSVKGLEYDVVHIVDVDGDSFETYRNEDEMACFYVACTRAKELLYLWYSA